MSHSTVGLFPKNLPIAAFANEDLLGSIIEEGIFMTNSPSMREDGGVIRRGKWNGVWEKV